MYFLMRMKDNWIKSILFLFITCLNYINNGPTHLLTLYLLKYAI